MIQETIDLEVQDLLDARADRVDDKGRRCVVRNGKLSGRQFLITTGPIKFRYPWVREKSPNIEDRVVFRPQLLPRQVRRSKAVDAPVPWGCISKVIP